MPTFTEEDKKQLDTLNKDYQNKAARSADFFPSGEPLSSKNAADASLIFMDKPPITPPPSSTDTITKHYPVDEGGVGVIRLTRERDVADGTTWLASPTWQASFGSGAASDEEKAAILKYFLTDADGAGYTPMYYSAEGVWIPNSGEYRPSIDPNGGVVRFAIPRPESGDTIEDSPYMCIYRRSGETLADQSFGAEVDENHFVDRLRAKLET